MSLIVTPRQLANRAQFYHQLGSLMTAGVAIVQSLEMLGRNPPGPFLRKPIQKVAERVSSGATLSESMTSLGSWLPAFDRALLEAAEQSGRLPETFRLLSSYYNDRAQLARQIIGDLLYPIFLVHLAVAILPTSQLVELVRTLDPVPYIRAKLAMLLPPYLIVFVLLMSGQDQRSESWRALIEQILRFIPMVGSVRRQLALARLAAALEALTNAGVSIIEGWTLAAAASGSPALRKEVASWRRSLDAGEAPGEILLQNSSFPELFASLYRTGELSGQLDDTLSRLRVHYQEEGSRKLRLLAQWIPRLIYLAVLIAIGVQIIHFWTGYYNGILDQFGQ